MALRKLTLILPLAPNALAQTHAAADLGRQVVAAGLDPNECYKVRDLEITEEDARFFLTEGYLMFGKPVNGAPLSAVFSADTDGGDGEILLLPPNRSERKSLSRDIPARRISASTSPRRRSSSPNPRPVR